MNEVEMKSALIHAEQELSGCHYVCDRDDRRASVMVAYNNIVRLGNALFPDMIEYRRQFNDFTG